MKKPMLESFFNKVVELKAYNVIEKRRQQRCFPASIANFLRHLSILKINGCFLK